MKKGCILLISVFVMNACFYKSVMQDDADDIIKARIYDYDGKTCLVMLEAVFQATSKQGGRGLTQITGFNEYRISVYDISDGRLLVRKKTGKQQSNPLVFLGCTPQNIWFYSFENGIHSLDPEKLEMKISQEIIFEKNPELRGNLAVCEGYQIPQFFQFNDVTQTIILTDNKGYRYFLNTVTLQAERSEREYTPFEEWGKRPFETYVNLPEPYFSISGDLRKQIRVNGKEVNPGITFLDGEFIAERNPAHLSKGIEDKIIFYSDTEKKLNDRIKVLKALNGGRGPEWRSPEQDTLRKLDNDRYTAERMHRDLKESQTDIHRQGSSHRYTQLLSPDTTSFFVFHRSGTAKDAGCIISRVELKNHRDLKEGWTTGIPGLFFDPSAARETSTFKEVFSKGNPEFGFSFFGLAGKKLIFVWMLHAVCLDTETGRIMWMKKI